MRLLPPVLALGLAAGGLALAAGEAAGAAEVTPSHRCGDCHRDIYRMWRNSAHARSLEDPIFLAAWEDTRRDEGEQVAATCRTCHAPLAALTGDTEMKERVTWEGVNCDYCHSIVSVKEKNGAPVPEVELSNVQRGPIERAESTGHEVAYSPLHATSTVCAPCHEYVNPEGTPIMTTYSEWKASQAAAAGQSCQNCHMGLTRADVVDPRVKRVALAEVNLHEVPGGHSLEQLHKALSVKIESTRGKGQLELQVHLTNRGAGHAVPTGMPGRRVILELTVETSHGKTFTEKRNYEKTFNTADGSAVVRGSGFFAPGVQLAGDTRIKADEHRIETFDFPVADDATAYANVKLHYEHAPQGMDDERVFLTFMSERRVIRP